MAQRMAQDAAGRRRFCCIISLHAWVLCLLTPWITWRQKISQESQKEKKLPPSTSTAHSPSAEKRNSLLGSLHWSLQWQPPNSKPPALPATHPVPDSSPRRQAEAGPERLRTHPTTRSPRRPRELPGGPGPLALSMRASGGPARHSSSQAPGGPSRRLRARPAVLRLPPATVS